MTDDSHQLINNVSLVSEQRQRVRDLSGFRKNHSVPTENSDQAQNFVGRIAAQEIRADLDAHFDEFRRHFRFKRIDLSVSEPDSGCGTILTPWFEYRVTVTHAPDDHGAAVWRREVSDFRNPQSVLSAEFATVFGRRFDTVEFALSEPILIRDLIDRLESRDADGLGLDYDRTATWCRLTSKDIPGRLTIRPECIALVARQPQLPALLLEAFFKFRTCLPGIACF